MRICVLDATAVYHVYSPSTVRVGLVCTDPFDTPTELYKFVDTVCEYGVMKIETDMQVIRLTWKSNDLHNFIMLERIMQYFGPKSASKVRKAIEAEQASETFAIVLSDTQLDRQEDLITMLSG